MVCPKNVKGGMIPERKELRVHRVRQKVKREGKGSRGELILGERQTSEVLRMEMGEKELSNRRK